MRHICLDIVISVYRYAVILQGLLRLLTSITNAAVYYIQQS